MANKEKTLSLKAFLDTTGFTKPLTEMKKELDQAGKEFKVTASEAKAFGSKADELKAKQKHLTDSIETQNKLLGTYKVALEKARKETGEDSKVTAKLKEEVRQATIKYNNLHSELKSVNKALDTNEEELKDVNNALEDNQENVKKSSGGWKDWIKGGLLAGGAAGVVGKVLGVIGTGLGKIKDFAGGAFSAIADGAKTALGFVQSLAQATGKIVMDSATRADEAATMAAKMGLTAKQVQELQYATELVDVDLETMAGSLSKLTVNIGNASKQQDDYNQKLKDAQKQHKKTKPALGDQAAAFKELGIKIKDAKGQFRDVNDVWTDTLKKLGKIKDETKRDILSQKLFGKSYAELKPLIVAGADALKKYAKEAHEVGYVMTDEQLKSLGELDDSYQQFKGTLIGFENILGASIAPGFKTFFDTINENAPQLQKDLTPALQDMGKAIGDAATVIAPHLPELAKAGVKILPSITDAFVAIAPSVEKIADKAPDLIGGMADAFKKMPEGTIEKFGNMAVTGFSALADAAVKSAPSLVDIISTTADNSEAFSSIIQTAADNAPQLASSLSDLAKNALPQMAKYGPAVAESIGWILDKLIKLADWLSKNERWMYLLNVWVGAANTISGNAYSTSTPQTSSGKGTTGLGGGGSIPAFATGGEAPGGIVWVGEHGPEPAILPRGARVVSHGEAMSTLRGGRGRLEVYGTVRVEGVNNRGELVAAEDILIDRIIDRLEREVRS